MELLQASSAPAPMYGDWDLAEGAPVLSLWKVPGGKLVLYRGEVKGKSIKFADETMKFAKFKAEMVCELKCAS